MDKPDSSICIRIEHVQSKGHITFNMPEAICNTTKRKFKKIVRLIILNAYHDDSIKLTLDSWFEYLLEREEKLWDDASCTFQEQFVIPECEKTQKEQQKIRANNNRLYDEVTRHKAAYEELMCRKNMYEKIKEANRQ